MEKKVEKIFRHFPPEGGEVVKQETKTRTFYITFLKSSSNTAFRLHDHTTLDSTNMQLLF